jgi:hypothetical protein
VRAGRSRAVLGLGTQQGAKAWVCSRGPSRLGRSGAKDFEPSVLIMQESAGRVVLRRKTMSEVTRSAASGGEPRGTEALCDSCSPSCAELGPSVSPRRHVTKDHVSCGQGAQAQHDAAHDHRGRRGTAPNGHATDPAPRLYRGPQRRLAPGRRPWP